MGVAGVATLVVPRVSSVRGRFVGRGEMRVCWNTEALLRSRRTLPCLDVAAELNNSSSSYSSMVATAVSATTEGMLLSGTSFSASSDDLFMLVCVTLLCLACKRSISRIICFSTSLPSLTSSMGTSSPLA
jgi:hypothetical protein